MNGEPSGPPFFLSLIDPCAAPPNNAINDCLLVYAASLAPLIYEGGG